ncbi:UDP-N-acetylmuramoylalanine--D-glutamate ligase [Spirochaetia bacterium]|nr:UDP-N-acetylmuramoylalanine--D-glutamate ligase [Spirochaetia bacterium]
MKNALDYSGVTALVMGLGLHGGGLESARFLAKHGAELIVTDLRNEDVLKPSIENLDAFITAHNAKAVRYVLGRHEMSDFEKADFVIKNPAVRPDSPYLRAAKCIETDISIFLKNNPARLTAVTGSKGKSFTASAIHFILNKAHNEKKFNCNGRAYLGGNITVSPLTFLEELTARDDVVLELSSWQLGDLPPRLLKPRIAVLTAIMSDHQDRYGNMENYIADKRLIYKWQDKNDATIANIDDINGWGKSFLKETNGRPFFYTARNTKEDDDSPCFVRGPIGVIAAGKYEEVVPAVCRVPGRHQKLNLLGAAMALLETGFTPEYIKQAAGIFNGVEHRLEFFGEKDGVRFYNDTTATIPEAAAACIKALKNPVLVTGGTDKDLDFSPLAAACAQAKAVFLLSGTGSDKLKILLDKAGLVSNGPFDSLEECLKALLRITQTGDNVVLTPGCASFGMFMNEFDRGLKWKEAVKKLCGLI